MNIETSQNDTPPATSLISYQSVIRFAWRRKSLLALGVVIGFVIGALYYVQKTPVYESEAKVWVIQKLPEAVTGQQARLQFEDYASTHRILIKSKLIVQRAIERENLGTLKCLQHSDDLTTAISSRLTVTRPSREAESVLELAFRGTFPDECGVVVNAIVESYKEFLAEAYDDLSEDTVVLITQARDLLENDLRGKETEYRDFREASPLIWNGQDDVNPRQERLAAIELQRSNLLLLKADLEGKLETIRKYQKQGRSHEQLVALVSDLSEDPVDTEAVQRGDGTLKTELLPLLLEEKRLRSDYGSNHPYVQAVKERIETTRNFFAVPSAWYIASMDENNEQSDLAKDEDNLIRMYLEYLGNEIERIETSERVLTSIYSKEHQEARKLNIYELRDEEFRTDIARTQALYDSLIERLQDASLVKDYGGFQAQIIEPAGIGKKVAPSLTLVAAGSIFLGLLLGVSMAYAAELGDQSFRSPNEIRQRLDLQILGQVPEYSPSSASDAHDANGVERDPMLCSLINPRSSEAEVFRAIRTALYFSNSGEDHKVLQITSPNPRDGKSTVAANLAVSVAMSNKSVLLIDADLRKPRQHSIFNARSDTGLASVIGLNVDPADAIQDTGIDNLSLMPAGPIPPDPAELLTSVRFVELLDVLRQKYDYVLIDSAPLLAVSDPSIVAARVDGVVLAIRVSQDGRAEAERAKDILMSMNANILGVVVNAVQNSGRFYYSSGYEYGQSDYYTSDDAVQLEASASS